MRHQKGITFLELLITLFVAAILATFAVSRFGNTEPNCDSPDARQSPLMRSKISAAAADIGRIHLAASNFELSNRRYPADLAEIGLEGLTDPWGNPYQYLVVEGRTDMGPVRKDHNLFPVNRNYDIYSLGPDGGTATPFTSTVGKDDIVIANDGDYLGLACQYNGAAVGAP
jgi:general secretion pathway protein G